MNGDRACGPAYADKPNRHQRAFVSCNSKLARRPQHESHEFVRRLSDGFPTGRRRFPPPCVKRGKRRTECPSPRMRFHQVPSEHRSESPGSASAGSNQVTTAPPLGLRSLPYNRSQARSKMGGAGAQPDSQTCSDRTRDSRSSAQRGRRLPESERDAKSS
jgi:hypothetical protein